MKFEFKNATLPCNDKKDFEGVGDIVCRIYLSKAPCEEHEKEALEIDGEFYDPECFFIETLIGRDTKNESFITGGWYLFYLDDDGNVHDFGYVHDNMGEEEQINEAWKFFEKEIGVEFYGN